MISHYQTRLRYPVNTLIDRVAQIWGKERVLLQLQTLTNARSDWLEASAEEVDNKGNIKVLRKITNKQASRDQDEADLKSGKKTREQLRKENGIFSAFDLTKAIIKRKLK